MRLLIFYLNKEKKPLLAFQSGIIFADFSCSFFCFSIAQKLYKADFILNLHKKYLIIIESTFIIFVFLLGIGYIISAKKRLNTTNNNYNYLEFQKTSHSKFIRHFFEGIVGTLTIPTLFPFWYLWWMGQNFTNKTQICLAVIPIALGVYFGDLLIFKTYRFFAGRLHEKIFNLKTVQIEVWVGYLLLFVAAVLFIKIFFP